MIKRIIKKEVHHYLRNPLYYLAIIFIILIVNGNISPYLDIIHLSTDDQLKDVQEYRYSGDLDVQDGYIPNTEEDMYNKGLKAISNMMTGGYGIDKKEAESIILEMQNKKMTIPDIAGYINKKFSRSDTIYFFLDYSMKKGKVNEINSYIDSRLVDDNFSDYFGRKYIDYLGLTLIFSSMILFAFLYYSDMKKDMYELLHTKALSPKQYIIGKTAGGFTALLLIVIIVTIIFDIIVTRHGLVNGFPINYLDLWKNVLLYVIPNILMAVSVYTFITVVFRNPLPAIPILLLYLVYSNMGASTDENGVLHYSPRFLSILVRMQEHFFETSVTLQVIVNQILLIVVSFVLTGLSIMIWKRRRLP